MAGRERPLSYCVTIVTCGVLSHTPALLQELPPIFTYTHGILEYSKFFRTPPCFTILISAIRLASKSTSAIFRTVCPFVRKFQHEKLTRENFVTRNILKLRYIIIMHISEYVACEVASP